MLLDELGESLCIQSTYTQHKPTQLANRTPPSLFNLPTGPSTETLAVRTN